MTRGKQAVQKRDAAQSHEPETNEVEAKAGSDFPPDGLAGPDAADSGTRPPRSDQLTSGRIEPSGDFLEVYRLTLPKPLINDIRGAMVGGHIAASYGQGGVVTRMWLEKSTNIIYARLQATKDPASEYRRTVAFVGDALIDLDANGATYGSR